VATVTVLRIVLIVLLLLGIVFTLIQRRHSRRRR
jgi:hypothetical protein